MKKHLRIIVRGKVQGVYFRASTKSVADILGIKGFVRNDKDGSVYIEAEGDELGLQQFMEWCHEGPEGAIVESVESTEGIMHAYTDFLIKKQ